MSQYTTPYTTPYSILQYGLILYTKNNSNYEYLLQNNPNGTYQDIRIDKNISDDSKICIKKIINMIIEYFNMNISNMNISNMNISYYDIKNYTYTYITSNKTLLVIAELSTSLYNSYVISRDNFAWVPHNKIKKIIKYKMLKHSSEYDLLNLVNHITNRKRYSTKIF